MGIHSNKKETLENEEDDETDTLPVSDTGASEDCQEVMHEMEVDSADEVVEIEDASPYLEEDDDSSRASTEETQAQNMTRSTSPATTTERRSQDCNHTSSFAANLQAIQHCSKF